MQRIVDIEGTERHLSVHRGHMVVRSEGIEVGRVPLDDIGGLIVHARSTTYSNNLICALADRGVLIVSSGKNFSPIAVTVPLVGHHEQTARMRAQASATKPMLKQAWKQIVCSKIRTQGLVLEAAGQDHRGFHLLVSRVRSGDPENVEATAAQRYWPRLFGPDFRRDRTSGGVNGMLNYGYAVLRACVGRSIVVSGLNPSLGIHHHNRQNPMALADDLIEPFRPIVDLFVFDLVQKGVIEVTSETKKRLAEVLTFDAEISPVQRPLYSSVLRLAQSLSSKLVGSSAHLNLPKYDASTLRGALQSSPLPKCPI